MRKFARFAALSLSRPGRLRWLPKAPWGVSLDDMIPGTKPAQVKAFLDKQKVAWPNVYYTGNPDTLGEHYRFDGQIPLTILYDANGTEVWRTQGTITKDETIARVREILRRKQ